jgi:molybdopterin-containing oxidoreductase family iron-sulfur binding subunit
VTPNSNFGAAHPEPSAGLEIVMRPDVYMYDGRYANNMWLQELPHPMTKLTWDNAIFLSPKTAKRLGFDNQQHVEL